LRVLLERYICGIIDLRRKVEGDNSNTRYHLQRFTRRTKIESCRCMEKVGLSRRKADSDAMDPPP
jgi:IS1 family transposase